MRNNSLSLKINSKLTHEVNAERLRRNKFSCRKHVLIVYKINFTKHIRKTIWSERGIFKIKIDEIFDLHYIQYSKRRYTVQRFFFSIKKFSREHSAQRYELSKLRGSSLEAFNLLF